MKIYQSYTWIIICLACFLLFPQISFGQEQLRSLEMNPALLKYRTTNPLSKLKSTSTDTIKLPFRDDFSTTDIVPDASKWEDQNVFINSTFADTLPSIGIATFDALDASGKIYTNSNKTGFNADKLTSKPISLSTQNDSLWLSFYFLPGGLGDPPTLKDTLILEYSVDNNIWTPQWKAVNYTDSINILQYKHGTSKWDTTFITKNLKNFQLAMLQIAKTDYKVKSFRFRFRNIASILGEIPGRLGTTDMWHIDYVYLNTGRSEKDTVYHDLTFYKPMSSLLTPYTSVPFNHYIISKSLVKPEIEYSIRNNHSKNLAAQKYIQYKEITNGTPTQSPYIQDFLKEKIDAHSFYTVNAQLENPFITNQTENVTFEIKSYFEHLNDDDYKGNDTVKYYQKFENYFAYDDGSPESGYGIENSNGIGAYGFTIYEEDTLTGVEIFFNPTLKEINKNYFFKLGIWANNKGKPGTSIYKDEDNKSRQPSELNKFIPFYFDTLIIIKDNRFFIGWYQVSDNFLNIGYDLNNPNGQSNLFYNTYGQWLQSGTGSIGVIPGSLMLRPIFKTHNPNGISNINSENTLKIYPNPAENLISLSGISSFNHVKQLIFINSIGQINKIVNNPTAENIDISDIPSGLYIVKIIFRNGKSQSIKLLKK